MMKVSSIGKKISLLVATLVMSALVLVPGVRSAHAAEINEPIITSASVASTPLYSVAGATVKLTMDFQLPNNIIHEGDTSTLTLPSGFTFAWTMDFNVEDNSGNVVARGHANTTNRTLVLTYTNYPETHSDIRGSIEAAMRREDETSNDYGMKTLTINDGNHTVNVNGQVDYRQWTGDNPNERLAKWTTIDPVNKQIIYHVRVNAHGDNLSNVVLEDTLSTPDARYAGPTPSGDEMISIQRGTFARDAVGNFYITNELASNSPEITAARASIAVNAQRNHFTINLGNLGTDGVVLTYAVVFGHEPVQSEAINNDVKITYGTPGQEESYHSRVMWQTVSGRANGYNYTIGIKKTDKNGNALKGAEFTVTRDRSGEVVGTVTTDDNGEATINGLLRDDYTITETKAPEGYTVAAPVKINGAQFDRSSLSAYVNVEDEKVPTSPVPPTEVSTKPKKKQQLSNTGSDVTALITGVAITASIALAVLVTRKKLA
ncbi:hypothetical protein EJ419_00445 [Alloscardovia theropitheci]|uniref:Isopeptide-forming domain-containing fimbrial protein n=1 Tax=Alloscardovia theropitheci TaxID=2496842 RepID=A0A4R0QYW6_9BIFI|nr:Ig-like domain-containing protein [Alloscardovia theropitheci]TCD54901.1 hypothetical protein EJ419_00445 [Alloscardovia theropitheci]